MKTSILFQRLEAAVLLLASFYFYGKLGGNWLLFLPLWLAIDLSMVGYLVSPKLGAYTYNAAHGLFTPAILLAAGVASETVWLQTLAVIFIAHIGLDRMLGYGLKENDGFTHTHLGVIGNKKK